MLPNMKCNSYEVSITHFFLNIARFAVYGDNCYKFSFEDEKSSILGTCTCNMHVFLYMLNWNGDEQGG